MRQEDYCLCLLCVGLEAHAVKEHAAGVGRRRCSIRGSDCERCVNVVLRLQVGPEGPHRHPLSALLAAHIAPAALIAVQVPHPRLVGVVGEAGADEAGKEYHRLHLRGVGLESDAVEVRTQGVEGLLEDDRVVGRDEVVVGIEHR